MELGVSLLVFGALVMTALAGYQPIDAYADTDLIFHMNVQHPALVVAGGIVAYAVESLLVASSAFSPLGRSFSRLLNRILLKYGLALVGLAGAILVFWHLPSFFDLASRDEGAHIVEHICFVSAGIMVVTGSKNLGPSIRLYLFFLLSLGMMVFGGYMVFDTGTIYASYPGDQQIPTGAGMLAEMASMSIVLGAYRLNKFLVTMERRGL